MDKMSPKNHCKISIAIYILSFLFFIAGLAFIIVGSQSKKHDASKDELKEVLDLACSYSEEAKRSGFDNFLYKVQTTVFKLHSHDVFNDPSTDLLSWDEYFNKVKSVFKAVDLSYNTTKLKTDTALRLLRELNNMSINLDQLFQRERKAHAQIKLYLEHTFGDPYGANFYTGFWMLGPNSFCYVPICFLDYSLRNALTVYEPRTLSDVEDIEEMLLTFSGAIHTYIDNLKIGVLKGMVQSIEACVAGIDVLERIYLEVSIQNETGVLKEWYTHNAMSGDYYQHLSQADQEEWRTKNGKNVSESVNEYLIEYIGKPIVRLLRYLKTEHLSHCVPSSVSSGLASLPLKYVYTDGVPDKSKPTDPSLPLTDMVLNGSKAYEVIMPYFTTNSMTPDEVHELGWKMLNKLYPKVVEIAKKITKVNDDATAVTEFRKVLNSSQSYFNDPIPQNESDENAHRLCSTTEGAKKYCPERWKAMEMWFSEARKVMSMLDPKIVNMFFFSGDKHTTPNCPIDLSPNLNPSSGAQSYEPSDIKCSVSATYNIPFFLGRVGPRYSEWSVNAHEARPGHHLQVQGNVEHFNDNCGGTIGWLNKAAYYTAFTEGWALYAENPLISDDTNTYDNEPMQEFGMLKWQLWRAIRLIVDTGLHYKGMTRAQALELFDQKAWDGTDLAQKEVTRYQSNPGQATAYMIGQLDIIKARQYATSKLGKDFDIKDFHYQVLSQGSSPLGYLSDHIKRYVDCKKDPKKVGCSEILEPPQKPSKTAQSKAKSRSVPLPLRPRKVHYI